MSAALTGILPLLLLLPGPCNMDRAAGPVIVEFTEDIITLEWRQPVLILPEKITITFEQVLDDSRCPLGVVCVWEGMTVVELSLQKSGQPATTFTLSDHDIERLNSDCCWKETQVWGLTFRYILLDPYPVYGVTPDSTDFRMQLEIGRRHSDKHGNALID
ncbi:MAG: hypothetical protein IH972_05960 [Candidatus Marinimicrobia bacterium]|nr:hypothetical protein [Candidatus Neomarinimicrobiota bacterium]